MPPFRPLLATSVALAADDMSEKTTCPPRAPLTAPPLFVMVALPAVEPSLNNVAPSLNVPLTVAPLLVMALLPAIELSRKYTSPPPAPRIAPPSLIKVPLPAVDLPRKYTCPPKPRSTRPLLLVKEPLAALEVSRNSMKLPPKFANALPLLVKTVRLPAIAPLEKNIRPCPTVSLTAVTKFCRIPELFVMPTPLMVNESNEEIGPAVIVNALAPALNTIPLTSVLAEIETLVRMEVANVAVSDEALGTVLGIQSLAVFQSPEPGLVCHVALPAKVVAGVKRRSSNMAVASRKARALCRRGEGNAPKSDEELWVVVFMSLFF